MRSLKLYVKLVMISIRSQMAYKGSFVMLSLAHFLTTFAEIAGLWVLFDRFKMVEGWTLAQVALIYAVVHMGFAIAEASARGFDTFSSIVRTGEFDRLLLRPCSTLLQVATRDFQLMRVGRFLQGFCVLVWACMESGIAPFSYDILVIAAATIGTASLFYGLFILQGTLSFWTIETLEIMNITTYGGVESGQYPMSIYKPGFRLFFTFVIPLACAAYYPIATLLHHEEFPRATAIFFPIAALLFLILSCRLWRLGERHYQSAGS